ncbi:MAG: hypothetical protein ACJ8EY_10705 [Sphingomicrobium sp.]
MTRPALAMDSRRFGRRFILHVLETRADRGSLNLSDDARLFLTTFAGGFLFVSLLIA